MDDFITIEMRDPDDRAPAYRANSIPLARARIDWRVTELDEEDICESALTVYKLEIVDREPDVTDEQIDEAMNWTFGTRGRCGHDHDCCGCRSYWVRDVIGADTDWIVSVSSSRNY